MNKMKLEDQVISLELAKELKKLGVEQKSIFYWGCDWKGKNYKIKIPSYGLIRHPELYHSAFTVAELGALLPVTMLFEKHRNGEWKMFDNLHFDFYSSDLNEANARAKMLIYLLENKLLELPK